MQAGIILINLESRPDRLLSVETSKAASDLVDVPMQRINAVDGNKVEYSGLLTKQARAELKDLKTTGLRTHHAQLTAGAIGCYLSHFEAWRAVAAAKHVPDTTPFLILEDDVELPQNAHALIQRGWDKLQATLKREAVASPKGMQKPFIVLWNVVCLSDCDGEDGDDVYEPDSFWSLMAYSLTPQTARSLLLMPFFPIDVQLDTQLYLMKALIRVFAYPCLRPAVQIMDTDIQVAVVPDAPYMRPVSVGKNGNQTGNEFNDVNALASQALMNAQEGKHATSATISSYIAAIVVLSVLLLITIATCIAVTLVKTKKT
jgi:GR25 family glycosyltransferase involved in LPS biosynthesis